MSSSRFLRLALPTAVAAAVASTVWVASASPLAIAGAARYEAKATSAARGKAARLRVAHPTNLALGNPKLAAPHATAPPAFGLDGLAGGLDSTVPVITVPADFSVEATGALTNVFYSASIVDDTDPSPVLICGPASGTGLSVGQTTVTCTGHDNAGNAAASKSFKITVTDTTAPVIANVPANIHEVSHDLAGTSVSYATPTASDIVDGSVPVDCAPATGSTFNIGRSVVTCTATDSHNQTSSQTFAVIVTYAPLGNPRPTVPDPVPAGPRSATPDNTATFGPRPTFPGP